MKSVFQLFCVLLLTSFAFVSCSNDDDDYNFPDEITNEIEYNGKSYEITSVTQIFFGDYYETGTNNIDLEIETEGFGNLSFELFVSLNSTKLVSGTYTSSNSRKAGTIHDGSDEKYNEEANISGAIKIEVSGNTYTIYLDCIYEGKAIRGSYKGTLEYEVELDED
ncbi:MAG: hypothetical protein LUH10_14460 [Tannerellaceae bacterium]|nr:hypothetical protein [Tannerellaceae bacterium]